MGRKPKLTTEEKAAICEQYLSGKKSMKMLAKKMAYRMVVPSFFNWVCQ